MKTITVIILLCSMGLLLAQSIVLPQKAEDFFTDGYCRQTTATTVEKTNGTIKAYVDGSWNEYKLVSFPKAFMEWNIDGRKEYMDVLRKMFKGESKEGPKLEGPHNGVVATYGFAGQGSLFKLNNAVKGMGFLPKAEKIDSVLTMLKQTNGYKPDKKLEILEGMYDNAENIFALDRQVSLELYAEPKFLTQSYTNQMINPVSTIVFMDIPSYKLKTIARLLDPADPKLTEYEKKVVEYINLIHSYFHGKFDKQFIAVIYYVVEVYDNSPGKKDARGLKIVP
jgi:hypothetical protein